MKTTAEVAVRPDAVREALGRMRTREEGLAYLAFMVRRVKVAAARAARGRHQEQVHFWSEPSEPKQSAAEMVAVYAIQVERLAEDAAHCQHTVSIWALVRDANAKSLSAAGYAEEAIRGVGNENHQRGRKAEQGVEVDWMCRRELERHLKGAKGKAA